MEKDNFKIKILPVLDDFEEQRKRVILQQMMVLFNSTKII